MEEALDNLVKHLMFGTEIPERSDNMESKVLEDIISSLILEREDGKIITEDEIKSFIEDKIDELVQEVQEELDNI